MAYSHTLRKARRQANLACESLEKREVLSTTGLSSSLTQAWGGHEWVASGGKGTGAQTFHFDHAKAGSSATVTAATTTDSTTSSSTTGFTGFGPGGPGGPGGKAPTLPAAVQSAQTKLQTDLKSFQTSPTKPSATSLAQLQTDLKAAQAGTLTNATTTLQNDQNAILASQGLTSSQISTIDSDQAALQAAMKAAFPNAPTPPGGGIMLGLAIPGGPGGGPGGHGGGPGGPGAAGDANLPTSVKTVLTQLQTDTKAAIGNPPKTPSAASVAQLKTDMAAIKAGTLSGTAATTAIQNDKNAILASQGATAAQISTINSDQTAVQAAFKTAFPNAPATPTGTGGVGFGFNPGGPNLS